MQLTAARVIMGAAAADACRSADGEPRWAEMEEVVES